LATVLGGVALWLVVGRKPPMMEGGLVVKPSWTIRVEVSALCGTRAGLRATPSGDPGSVLQGHGYQSFLEL
jgi:hypothetical protein